MSNSSSAAQPALTAADADRAAVERGRHTRLPGNTGIWVFILVDLIFFAMLFLSFVMERSGKAALFAASQKTLNFELGLVNTLILLTSSWLVVLAVEAARAGKQKMVPRFLMLAIACGLAFIAIKIFEYSAKFSVGISMLTNDFFMFYFLVTGIHFVHVIAGTGVLTFIVHRAKSGAYQPGQVQGIEMAAVYWHMVDLLWVMLFPLIYLSS